MPRLRTCEVCGAPTSSRRCRKHALPPAPRGRAFDARRLRIAERDNWTCQLCGRAIDPTLRKPNPDALHIDHVKPRAAQGDDSDANLRATHARCNLERGTRDDAAAGKRPRVDQRV